MNERINSGYRITDSVHLGESEFVLGVRMEAPEQYVTWKCRNGDYYYWDRYFSNLLDAQKNLIQRACDELRLREAPRKEAER